MYGIKPYLRNDNVITRATLYFRGSYASSGSEEAKRETLNIRIQPKIRGLIDRAAAMVGKNRTDFVLDAARRAAEDALLDRTVLEVGPKAYAEFQARLDAPPQPNEKLRRTLRTPAPWER